MTDPKTIMKRLRSYVPRFYPLPGLVSVDGTAKDDDATDLYEAADLIESQAATIERLRGDLELLRGYCSKAGLKRWQATLASLDKGNK